MRLSARAGRYLLLLSLLLSTAGVQAQEVVRIGILATRGPERCLRRWVPTAEYLAEAIPDCRFEIVPLDFPGISAAVRDRTVQFVLANSSVYVGLEQNYHVQRIVTLKNAGPGNQVTTQFGGVLFSLADGSVDISQPADLDGRTVGAVAETALGGYQAVWYELEMAGFDVDRRLGQIQFLGTHDAVVEGVLSGAVDAGMVRTDTLERMAEEGLLDLSRIRILSLATDIDASFPFERSTRLYPEWPMASVQGTSADTSERVASALLALSPDSPTATAANCAGWTIPLHYSPVRKCLQYLGLPPYEDHGHVPLSTVLSQYWAWIAGTLVLIAAVGVICLRLATVNRALSATLARLAESEEKSRSIIGNIGIGVCLLDLDRRLVEFNDLLLRWFPQLDASGRPFCRDAFGEYDSPSCTPENCPSLKALNDGQRYETMRTVTLPDVGERKLRVVASALRNAEGSVSGVLETFEDITERVRIEEELRHREEMFRTISSTAQDAIIMIGAEGEVTYWNEAAERIFGWSAAEVMGKGVHDILPPGDLRQAAHDGFDGFTETGDGPAVGSTLELDAIHKEGHQFPVEISVSSVRSGDAWHAIGIVRDATERKARDAALQAANDHQRMLLDTAATAIFTVDTARKITSVNAEFCRTTGFSAEEAIGESCQILQGIPCDQTCDVYSLAPGEQICRRQFNIRSKDGRRLTIHRNASIVRDSKGKATGAIESFVDVTEIIAAREAAEQANRVKSDFLASMSHEIRTPMNGIVGMTELALDTELDPEQRHFLESVRGSAHALLSLLNDILDFAKIEAGHLEMGEYPFSLRNTLAAAVRALSTQAEAKDLELAFAVDPAVPDGVLGDPMRLRQILINLVGNAVKFTDQGEIVVRIACLEEEEEEEEEEAVWIEATVTDTGIGIPKEKQALIFEQFSQADGATSREYGGTGLGLAVSAQLVRMMGGRISVESPNPAARGGGNGSVFHFTARFGISHIDTSEGLCLDSEQLAGIHALIVDDNATTRDILSRMLLNWNMDPQAVDSRASAAAELEKASLANHPFRLALLDCNMPDSDGFAVLEHVRKDSRYQGISVIMLTSVTRRDDSVRGMKMGADACLLKPVRQSELLDAILRSLGVQVLEPVRVRRSAMTGTGTEVDEDGKPIGDAISLRILIAEDNPINQELAQRAVDRMGHSPTVVGNGREAVEALRKDAFDLVLMDVQMPEMDGLAATRAIRSPDADVANRDIPIIAMTANAMKGDREACLEAGMNAYMPKPLNRIAIRTVIEQNAMLRHPPDVAAESAEPAASGGGTVSDTSAGLNQADLLDNFDGDVAFLKRIIGMFLDNADAMMTDIEKAVEAGDADALRISAHTYKGAISIFGDERTRQGALRLEVMGRENDLDESREALSDLQRRSDRLRKGLRTFQEHFQEQEPDV